MNRNVRKREMKLYTSISSDEWNPSFLKRGIKAGEISGTSDGKPAILCQSKPFPLDGFSMIVEFEKSLDQIYIDYDDDVDAPLQISDEQWKKLREGCPLSELGVPLTYGQAGVTEKELKPYTMYGSYVVEIRPEEIRDVCPAYFDSEISGVFLVGSEKR